MKKYIVAGAVFLFVGMACSLGAIGIGFANAPSQEEELIESYQEAVRDGDLESVLSINRIDKQGLFKRYKEEDIPYLGMKPNMIMGNRKSGNSGENGSLEYVVVYWEDEEMKYRIECDEVAKSDGKMYLLHW